MIRYEFMDETIREEDIHPDLIFEKERNLARQFVEHIERPQIIQPCPVCRTDRTEILFEKWGVAYAMCPLTWSIGIAHIPDAAVIFQFFHESELARVRGSREYQDQVIRRRRDLWEHQIGWMEGRIHRYLGNDTYRVIDWGGKYIGWIDTLGTASFVDELSAEEPLPPITRKGPSMESADIVSLIDVLQRVQIPDAFLRNIYQRLRPGGLLIAACRSGSGFDILTLRENSENIFPLDHIYLPSPQELKLLLEKSGFEVLELTTPGLLDMRYIKNAVDRIPHDQFFQRYILDTKDEKFLERMQGFLQRNNLSSHLRCVARRR